MTRATLRLLTLNLWNKSGPWEQRRTALRALLREEAPDVVGLQEVLRFQDERGAPTPGGDQLAELVDELPYTASFGGATDLGGGLWLGNGLLTRWPVVEQEVLPLPHEVDGQRRSVLFARLATPTGELPVFVTHLHWRLHHGCLRLEQVQRLVELVFERAPVGGAALPPVLLGDFNAEPDSDELRYLRGLATLGGKSVYFCDAWLAAGDGSPGYTFDRSNAYAALAHEPSRRIDYVLVRGPDARLRGEPLAARLVGTVPLATREGPVWVSDHFGVLVELAV